MYKILMIVNTVMTLPFAVAAMVAPAAVFSDFGLKLDSGAALIARGYASTLLGYGLIVWFLRDTDVRSMRLKALIASLLFNICEFVVQLAARLENVANPIIWVTIVAHGAVTLMTIVAIVQQKKTCD